MILDVWLLLILLLDPSLADDASAAAGARDAFLVSFVVGGARRAHGAALCAMPALPVPRIFRRGVVPGGVLEAPLAHHLAAAPVNNIIGAPHEPETLRRPHADVAVARRRLDYHRARRRLLRNKNWNIGNNIRNIHVNVHVHIDVVQVHVYRDPRRRDLHRLRRRLLMFILVQRHITCAEAHRIGRPRHRHRLRDRLRNRHRGVIQWLKTDGAIVIGIESIDAKIIHINTHGAVDVRRHG